MYTVGLLVNKVLVHEVSGAWHALTNIHSDWISIVLWGLAIFTYVIVHYICCLVSWSVNVNDSAQ